MTQAPLSTLAAPRFSVLVTCYNYRDYVIEAVNSALAQTLPPVEVLVIDDGSTDGSGERLQQHFGGRAEVRVISQPNAGQLRAFRTGCAAARGEVLAFLDADDLWTPDHLASLAEAMRQHPDADYLYSNMEYFGARQGFEQPSAEPRVIGITTHLVMRKGEWNSAATSGIAMRIKLARPLFALLPDHFDEQWRTCADTAVAHTADFLSAFKVYTGLATARYRQHDRNDWLGQPKNKVYALRFEARRRRLFTHLERQFDARNRAFGHFIVPEFKTGRDVSWHYCWQYLCILWASKLPLHWKLRYCPTILRHYLQHRRR